MKILDLDGSSYERGYYQGKAMRKHYRLLLNDFFSSDLWRDNRPGMLPELMVLPSLGLMSKTFNCKAIHKYLPAQAERIKGIAKGLGVSELACWGIHFLELLFCEAGKTLQAPGGCTQLHATPAATADGYPLSARNYDFPNLLENYQIIRREVPSEKNRFSTTTITHAMLAGAHQGINEHGLMVCVNNARLWKGKDFRFKGVPYQLLLVEALETCRNTKEAVKYISEFPARTNAGFFGIADLHGDVKIIEFTASRAVIKEPDSLGVIAQTNHYIKMPDANLPKGTYWTVKGMEGQEYALSSNRRYEVAKNKLTEAAGKITIDTMKDILRDHSANNGVGSDFTICCHGKSGSTLSSIIVDIKNKKMWVAKGKPCENEYRLIEFRNHMKWRSRSSNFTSSLSGLLLTQSQKVWDRIPLSDVPGILRQKLSACSKTKDIDVEEYFSN